MKFAPNVPAAIALAAATAVGGAAFAQSQQQGQMSQRQSQQQADAKDMAEVTIKRSSTWGFSNEVRKYLADAYEDMYKDPEESVSDLKLATNMVEILAAACEDEQGSQALQDAADELSRFTQKLENRQIANPDDLSQPGAAVVLAIAKAQFLEAQKGLEEADESAVGYSLDSAADNLLQAHVYLKKQPSEESARAIFNAHRLGTQIKSLVEATTQQGDPYTVAIPEEQGDVEKVGVLDSAQIASARSGGSGGEAEQDLGAAGQIPQIAPEIIEALGTAIEEAASAAEQASASEE